MVKKEGEEVSEEVKETEKEDSVEKEDSDTEEESDRTPRLTRLELDPISSSLHPIDY